MDDISDKDREEINRRMHSEVLETNGFEEVVYECHRLSTVQKTGEGQYAATLDGELILHGVQRNHAITARINVKDDSLRAAGDFTVRLSDYEIKPVSAAGGTIKLKDDLKLSFDIIARGRARNVECTKMNEKHAGHDLPGGCRMCLAIPGKIVEISSDNPDSALVDVVGVRRRIDLGLLHDDRPVPGDWVLIHVGFAMSKISEQMTLDQMKRSECSEKSKEPCRKSRDTGLGEVSLK